MLLVHLDPRLSRLIRLIGLGLIDWSVVSSSSHPAGTSGRGLVVTILLVICSLSWIAWVVRLVDFDLGGPVTADTYVLALAGGLLTGASPGSAASVFVFVALVSAAMRAPLDRVWPVFAAASVPFAAAVLIWDSHGLGLLAFVVAFAAAVLAGSNLRQVRERAEQAELLLAQTQRSQEESLRAARLQESTRIAREIHDVLAHALAGLTIQLEATTALIENGAEPEQVLDRVRRAHELARDGLRETRRAVGALRDGGEEPVPDALATLAAAQSAQLSLRGDATRLRGEVGKTVLRVVQESLTNVIKHAPGSAAQIAIDVGEQVVVTVENPVAGVPVAAGPLADSGGGYGIAGMRERAEALGGTLSAGPSEAGWRVALRLPVDGGER